MSKITYTNKSTLNPQPSIAEENKVTSDDMNEIKNVVNANDDNVGDLANLNTTEKSNIVGAINEVNNNLNNMIKSVVLNGTTNSSGEINVTTINNDYAPGKIIILGTNSASLIGYVATNSNETNFLVGFRYRGTTYSPVPNSTNITFTMYYIEI